MQNYENVVDLNETVIDLDETVVDETVAPESGHDAALESGQDEQPTEPKLGFRKRSADEIAAAPKKVRVQNSASDIESVLLMRQDGLSFMKIEALMGWPNSHGNRAWRICRDYAIVVPEAAQ